MTKKQKAGIVILDIVEHHSSGLSDEARISMMEERSVGIFPLSSSICFPGIFVPVEMNSRFLADRVRERRVLP